MAQHFSSEDVTARFHEDILTSEESEVQLYVPEARVRSMVTLDGTMLVTIPGQLVVGIVAEAVRAQLVGEIEQLAPAALLRRGLA